MALRLEQFAHHRSDVGWPPDGKHFVVLNRRTAVGTIAMHGGGPADRTWMWSVTDLRVVPAPFTTYGVEPTREEA